LGFESILDLWQKSGFEFGFQIVDGCHQIKAESKTSAPLAIILAPNRTDLQFANHRLTKYGFRLKADWLLSPLGYRIDVWISSVLTIFWQAISVALIARISPITNLLADCLSLHG